MLQFCTHGWQKHVQPTTSSNSFRMCIVAGNAPSRTGCPVDCATLAASFLEGWGKLRRNGVEFFHFQPVATMSLLGIVGLVATLVLPKKYTSTTIVLVEQPTVPVDIVKPVVTNDLNQRLASMKEEILSRSRLQPIIEKFNLYPQREKAH